MQSRLALTHVPSIRLQAGERTFVTEAAIDAELAGRQHLEYCCALERLGVAVRRLDVNGDQPDAVFLEDTAVVLDEAAVVANMGAKSRRGETVAVAAVLRDY